MRNCVNYPKDAILNVFLAPWSPVVQILCLARDGQPPDVNRPQSGKYLKIFMRFEITPEVGRALLVAPERELFSVLEDTNGGHGLVMK